MQEYGSDYHYIKGFRSNGETPRRLSSLASYYADGRQTLIHLFQSQKWKRLWLPAYFCYDVVNSLKQAGLNLCFYVDFPGNEEDDMSLTSIQEQGLFSPTDAVLRVNYFGTRSFRRIGKLPVAAVIEDHTHDLIGEWSLNSQADWCIASLRKTLPIPEGGVLWSPVGLPLPTAPEPSDANERIASIRWDAMRLKTRYLAGEEVDKPSFRTRFIDTEPFFKTAPVCSLDRRSQEFLESFDIQNWYREKRENWALLCDIKKNGVQVLLPESMECNPFSLILLFDSSLERDRVRKALIDNRIYPAVLWDVPASVDSEVLRISGSMLSIHCDARYTRKDILTMRSIIESIL